MQLALLLGMCILLIRWELLYSLPRTGEVQNNLGLHMQNQMAKPQWMYSGNHYIVWSRPTDESGQCSVTLVIPKCLHTSLIGWKPVSDWLLTMFFLYKHGKMTITVAYALTDISIEDTKDMYYSLLNGIIQTSLPMTYWYPDWHQCNECFLLTWHDVPTIYHRYQSSHQWQWRTFTPFCCNTGLCIADTWYPHKCIHHWTC